MKLKTYSRIFLGILFTLAIGALVYLPITINDDYSKNDTLVKEARAQVAEPVWTFQESFDGMPGAPTQDLPANFDWVHTHRTLGSQNHYTIDSDTDGSRDSFGYTPADHDDTCGAPPLYEDFNNNALSALPSGMHAFKHSYLTDGNDPDLSFYRCNNHLMSAVLEPYYTSPAMDDLVVEDNYGVTQFWAKQEFVFDGVDNNNNPVDGGVVQWDVNINEDMQRQWYEVMIVPKEHLKMSAADTRFASLPFGENYPKDSIVLKYGFINDGTEKRRDILVVDDNSEVLNTNDFSEGDKSNYFANTYCDSGSNPIDNPENCDPALSNRRIRRSNRITLDEDAEGNASITWGIEDEDGNFDDYTVNLDRELPFDAGLVVFKSHAYHPSKDGSGNGMRNYYNSTFHWDEIYFTGPTGQIYNTYETDEESDIFTMNGDDTITENYVHQEGLANSANSFTLLQRNGDMPIGSTATQTIELPADPSTLGFNPRIAAQFNSPKTGQVLLSINGGEQQVIEPYNPGENFTDRVYEYIPSPSDAGNESCYSEHWATFIWEVDPSVLQSGTNTFEWEVGPQPDCVGSFPWSGFSVKSLEIQFTQNEFRPETNFTFRSVDETNTRNVQFNDTTLNNPTSWSWDFDNDGIEDSTDENPIYEFSADGTYEVSLTTTNGSGVEVTETITMEVLGASIVQPTLAQASTTSSSGSSDGDNTDDNQVDSNAQAPTNNDEDSDDDTEEDEEELVATGTNVVRVVGIVAFVSAIIGVALYYFVFKKEQNNK